MSDTSESGTGPTHFQVRPPPAFSIAAFSVSAPVAPNPLATPFLALSFSTHFPAWVPSTPVERVRKERKEGGRKEGAQAHPFSAISSCSEEGEALLG